MTTETRKKANLRQEEEQQELERQRRQNYITVCLPLSFFLSFFMTNVKDKFREIRS